MNTEPASTEPERRTKRAALTLFVATRWAAAAAARYFLPRAEAAVYCQACR